jgi:imidazoleglycerol-phosphate dehydratase
MRSAKIHRKTRETDVRVSLNIDGDGRCNVDTGVGFFDHMIGHVAMHGLFDLELEATGDLHIDSHHTLEDCALALGQAFDRALGERQGIHRVGFAYMPMDEALAFVAVDLSGRPYAVIEAEWHTPELGGIATSLFPHVLDSFATATRCNLHARVLYGRDDHHQAEALFKALGRALDEATRIDPRRKGAVPSTKGTLV